MSVCLYPFQDRSGCVHCEADVLGVSVLVTVCDNESWHLRAPARSPGGREEEALAHFYHVSGSVLGTFIDSPLGRCIWGIYFFSFKFLFIFL